MTLRHFNKLFLPLAIVAVVMVIYAAKGEEDTTGGQTVTYKGQTFTVFVADREKHEISMHWQDGTGKPYSSIGKLLTAQQKEGKKVLMITNAGMFKPDFSPNGLYIESYETLVSIDTTSGSGNFYLKPNGVFMIGDLSYVFTTDYYQQMGSMLVCSNATQSGPMLVINDTIHPAFQPNSTNKYIRSGVGVDSLFRVQFAISNQPVNLHTFASLFKEQLGCKNALYLDGAISKMYLPPLRNDLGGQFGPMIMVTEK